MRVLAVFFVFVCLMNSILPSILGWHNDKYTAKAAIHADERWWVSVAQWILYSREGTKIGGG
ncbi:MAG TPA: hypothetical protein DDY39_13475 [Nitrospira sp.]|nr:hypothetical protein [Nitrospira sp.]